MAAEGAGGSEERVNLHVEEMTGLLQNLCIFFVYPSIPPIYRFSLSCNAFVPRRAPKYFLCIAHQLQMLFRTCKTASKYQLSGPRCLEGYRRANQRDLISQVFVKVAIYKVIYLYVLVYTNRYNKRSDELQITAFQL